MTLERLKEKVLEEAWVKQNIFAKFYLIFMDIPPFAHHGAHSSMLWVPKMEIS